MPWPPSPGTGGSPCFTGPAGLATWRARPCPRGAEEEHMPPSPPWWGGRTRARAGECCRRWEDVGDILPCTSAPTQGQGGRRPRPGRGSDPRELALAPSPSTSRGSEEGGGVGAAPQRASLLCPLPCTCSGPASCDSQALRTEEVGATRGALPCTREWEPIGPPCTSEEVGPAGPDERGRRPGLGVRAVHARPAVSSRRPATPKHTCTLARPSFAPQVRSLCEHPWVSPEVRTPASLGWSMVRGR